jgi:hypothetical protein
MRARKDVKSISDALFPRKARDMIIAAMKKDFEGIGILNPIRGAS